MIEGTVYPTPEEVQAKYPEYYIQNTPAISSNAGLNDDENLIIGEAQKQGINNPNQLAYILATAKHESGNFNYTQEIDGANQAIKNGYEGGANYFGRGFVQLTHLGNYKKYADKTGVDLVNNPDLLSSDKNLAAFVLVDGMKTGAFTGARLEDYINNDHTNFTDARRIVNGTDRAGDIAKIANQYLKKL